MRCPIVVSMKNARSGAVILASLTVLAGCTAATPTPTAPPATKTAVVPTSPAPSAGSGFAPSGTSIAPPTALAAPITGEPQWSAPGKFVTTWPDLVVVTHRGTDSFTSVVGYGPEGSEKWRYLAVPPQGIHQQTAPAVMRLGEKLAVFWSGEDESARASDGSGVAPVVTFFTFVDRSTGEAPPAQKLAEVGAGVQQVSMDSFEFNAPTMAAMAGPKKSAVVSPDGSIKIADGTPLGSGEAGLAAVPEGLSFAPAPDAGLTGKAFWIDSDHIVRQFKSGGHRWYQVVSGSVQSPTAVGPAVQCDDEEPVSARVWSPDRSRVAFGQAVAEVATGKVTCLASVSTDLVTRPSVVADDGSAFGTAVPMPGGSSEGTFFVDGSGKGSASTSSAAVPVALLSDLAIFAGASGDGVVAYGR